MRRESDSTTWLISGNLSHLPPLKSVDCGVPLPYPGLAVFSSVPFLFQLSVFSPVPGLMMNGAMCASGWPDIKTMDNMAPLIVSQLLIYLGYK